MEKLKALNFDNANNAAMSLHTLAEWVRTGDMKVTVTSDAAHDCEPHSADLMVGFAEPGKR
jgi:hypothetical protein